METNSLSESKLLANQANAQKSSGPRTESGKKNSSKNSLKHGITSPAPIVKDERMEDWQNFLQGFISTHEPVGLHETVLVHRIALLHWRLFRVIRHENAVSSNPTFDMDNPVLQSGDAVLPNPDDLMAIQKFEAHLHRMLFSTLHELQRLQAMRAGMEIPLPTVVDVTVNTSDSGNE